MSRVVAPEADVLPVQGDGSRLRWECGSDGEFASVGTPVTVFSAATTPYQRGMMHVRSNTNSSCFMKKMVISAWRSTLPKTSSLSTGASSGWRKESRSAG
eukprot:scaffold167834_cov33-Tisochrysis_lutea.AAC.1